MTVYRFYFPRSVVLLALFFICFSAFAQERTLYFTFDGKPALPDSAQRTRKGVLQGNKWTVLEYEKYQASPVAEAFYLDSNFLVRDGDYTEYWNYAAKIIHYRWQYSNGKKTGLCTSFYESGKPNDSSFYVADGHLIKYRSYYESGRLEDTALLDASGKGVSRGFWEDGRLEHSGQFASWIKTGPWSYYSKRGKLCAIETMKADTIFSAVDYDENGQHPIPHKGDYARESDYPGGINHWTYYMNKTLSAATLPKSFLEDEIAGTVVVIFTVNEQGEVGDLKAVQSVSPELDALSISVVSKSGLWIPAMRHNRLMKTWKKQPFVFKLVGN